MTRRTRGIHTVVIGTAAGGMIGLGLFAAAGCTPQERTTTARSAAQVAAASVTSTAAGQSTSAAARREPMIKPNGRGGFDSSQAQKNALARAHYWRDHHNDVMKPYRPTTQPTSQPTATTSLFGG